MGLGTFCTKATDGQRVERIEITWPCVDPARSSFNHRHGGAISVLMVEDGDLGHGHQPIGSSAM